MMKLIEVERRRNYVVSNEHIFSGFIHFKMCIESVLQNPDGEKTRLDVLSDLFDIILARMTNKHSYFVTTLTVFEQKNSC